MPLLSVVIPLYNKASYIDRALHSVLGQTFQDFDVIVVDDGSQDGGPHAVEAYADPRIRLISQKHAGASAARNRGAAESASELIAFLDADDEWLPGFLDAVVALYRKYPDAGLYATAHLRCGADGKVLHMEYVAVPPAPWEGLLPHYFITVAESEPPFCSSSICISRKIFCELGGFPTEIEIGEDLFFYFKIALRYRMAFSWHTGAVYHQEATNRSGHEVYGDRRMKESIIQAGLEAISRGIVSADAMLELHEYLGGYQLTLVRLLLSENNPQLARWHLANCKTKRLYLSQLIWSFCTWVPAPLLNCGRRVFRHVVSLLPR